MANQHSNFGAAIDRPLPNLEIHFLGQVDFDVCWKLQQRLIYEAGGRDEPRAFLLVAEHRPLITVGRMGSRAQIRLSDEELNRRQIEVRYVARGGGCCLHGPGQLALYALVPFEKLGWTLGQFLRAFHSGLAAVLAELAIPVVKTETAGQANTGLHALSGRTGPLVVFGVGARYGVTCHGAFCNVMPDPGLFGYIDVVPPSASLGGKTTLSSLLAERGRAVKMHLVKSLLVPHLAAALHAERHQMHTGHPWLPEIRESPRAASGA